MQLAAAPAETTGEGAGRAVRERGAEAGLGFAWGRAAREEAAVGSRRGWWVWVVGAVLVSGPGCLSGLHPVKPPPSVVCAPVHDLPRCCKDRVHIFIIHGLDPLDYANLAGVREYFHSLGFTNTYYGQCYHGGYFADEIRRIHAADPEARFVLLGFSAGANVACAMTRALGEKDQITIDLLVYLGGNTLDNEPASRPANALRVVHILASGYIWKGEPIDGAENYRYTDVWHFGSPTHGATLETLARELAVVAERVTFVESVPPDPPRSGPVPRQVSRNAPAAPLPDDWDFLRPAVHLRRLDEVAPAAVVVERPAAEVPTQANREHPR